MSTGDVIVLVIAFLMGGLFVTWFFLKRSYERRFPAGKAAAERKVVEERLLRPDWEFYERHLQRRAPSALRELFADRELITAGGLEYSKAYGISTFDPLDQDSLIDTAGELGHDIIPFATSDCGDPIFLRPGADQADTVFIAIHDDPGKVEVLADSVETLLERLRKANA